MTIVALAAIALAAQTSVAPAGTPVQSNLEYATPVAGSWAYSATGDGSEASFSSGRGQPQLTIQCTRSTRRITFSKAAPIAAPSIWVWTSSQSKSLPANYDASALRVSTDLAAFDPFLDAIASSRGRIGFSSSGLAALVVPPWSEVARVIEDCRV